MSENTQAENLITMKRLNEISMCIGSGSATQKNDEMSYLHKSEVKLTDEQEQEAELLLKAEDEVVMTLSFQEFVQKFLGMYGDNAATLCKLMGYSYSEDVYPRTEAEAKSLIDERVGKIQLLKSGKELSLDEQIHFTQTQISFEKALAKSEGDLPNSAFAYVPDKDKTSTRKLRIDDANHVRSAVAALGSGGMMGNKVQIPKEHLAAVKDKVRAAYKEFYPEKDVPNVLKALDKNGSDIVSGSNVNNKDNESPDTNKEENMSKDNGQEITLEELKTLRKAQAEMLEMKKTMEALEKAKKEDQEQIEALKKAQEEAKESAAKEKLMTLVKSWDGISEESHEGVVSALYKSEDHEILLKAFEEQETRIQKLKEDFGTEEHGSDGQVESVTKADSIVDAADKILQAKYKGE